ncbi:MAG: hypothetical protein M1822_010028 [Bathelium mastoideum]|nr:MAG: hypothetical protein M1822_010028 [Bathelium mastoideum]
MASEWNHGDNTFDFDSFLAGDASYNRQSLEDELMGFVSQTTERDHEPQETLATESFPQKNPETLAKSQGILPQSNVSSQSPDSSVHDSSSDSSGHRKRKTSSTSSPTLWPNMNSHMNSLKVSDKKQEEDVSMSQTPKGVIGQDFGASPPVSYSMGNSVDYSDKAMAGFFDIDSAAASPGAFGNMSDMGAMMASQSPVVPSDSKNRRSDVQQMTPMANNGLFFLGSRDQSPLDGNIGMNQASGSATMFNAGPSPPDQYGMGSAWSGAPSNLWDSNNYGLETMNFSPSPVVNNSMLKPAETRQDTDATASKLYIDPTTRKSRVETQIPIKLTLTRPPEGVKRLHLPTHTIAKPKMISKDPKSGSDILELQVMLVCASAMKNEKAKQRAFRLAAGTEPKIKREIPSSNRSSPQHGDADDDPDKPLNGGEVRICKNCINREAKRAARKKVKNPEDERNWRRYENDRVVVFNTNEYKEWTPWEPSKPENATNSPDNKQESMPEGSVMVEVPMRIACYCRHQGEKDGFQIVFTIKDTNGRLIAQNMSESILITDDHKTQPGSIIPDATSSYMNIPNAGFMEQASQLSRGYHSTPDLIGLQQHAPSFLPQQQLYHSSKLPSRTTSAAETPKNLSRPASPDGSSSGPNKKRKSSGPSSNRYSGLMMTPVSINTGQQATPTSMPNSAAVMSTATPPGHFSSFSPQRFTFPQTADGAALDSAFSQPPGPSYFPPEPQSRTATRNGSFSNSYYSAPGSQMPSRASSPVSHRPNHSYQNNLAQRVHANFNQFSNPAIASPTESGPSSAHSIPLIHKLSPAEGPTAGNTEVSIYGSGFYPGLDVVFGNTPAISTTFWGDKALLCVLPPSAQPGPVNVTFSGPPMQAMFAASSSQTQPAIFTYKDDNKEKRDLLELFRKMMSDQRGYIPEDYMDYVKPYIPSGDPNYPGAASGPHGGRQHSYNRSRAAAIGSMVGTNDAEETILQFLKLQDGKSDHRFDVDLKSADGSTLLSLVCSMGYSRAVAALLTCHANPDTRDANGLTPLIIAAMRGHIQVVHLLLRKGADPTVRTLHGRTAADLACSDEVRLALLHVPNHSRTSSGLRSLRSGRSSPDLRSLNSFYTTTDESSGASDEEDVSGCSNEMVMKRHKGGRVKSRYQYHPQSGLQSRRNSLAMPPSLAPPSPGTDDQQNYMSPYAAMTAWRDSLSAQIQHFQESMQRSLPNFPSWQLPALPPLPNLPDYQDHPMMRRISSLVPNRNFCPPPASLSAASSSDETQRPTEAPQSFWDFFSSTPAPPSYEDLYPERRDRVTFEDKKMGVVQAFAETIFDQKCEQRFDQEGTSARMRHVPSGTVHIVSHETAERKDQQRARALCAQKMLRNDITFCYFWIPLLVAFSCAIIKPSFFQSLIANASFLHSRTNQHPDGLRA